jgi:hypothetical protein
MKKVLIVIIIIVLFIFSYFLNVYSVNYPSELNFHTLSYDSDMKVFMYVFLIISILSALLALSPFKNKSYNCRFLFFFSILNLGFILINLVESSNQYFEKKDQFEDLLVKTKQQAKYDIKKDFIKYYYFGGDSFPTTSYNTHQKLNREIDSLTKRYGVIYINQGGAVDEISVELNKKHEEYTAIYLEKRNGKNWKYRMKNEVQFIKNKYKE